MRQFKVHTIEDVTIVEFLVPGLTEIYQFECITGQLRETLGRSEPKKIILDFSRVRFMSSHVVGILISLQRTVETHQGRLIICGLNERLKNALRLCELDRLLSFNNTTDDALAAMAGRDDSEAL